MRRKTIRTAMGDAEYKGKRILIHPYGSVLGGRMHQVIVWGKNKSILHSKAGFKSLSSAMEYKKKLRKLGRRTK